MRSRARDPPRQACEDVWERPEHTCCLVMCRVPECTDRNWQLEDSRESGFSAWGAGCPDKEACFTGTGLRPLTSELTRSAGRTICQPGAVHLRESSRPTLDNSILISCCCILRTRYRKTILNRPPSSAKNNRECADSGTGVFHTEARRCRWGRLSASNCCASSGLAFCPVVFHLSDPSPSPDCSFLRSTSRASTRNCPVHSHAACPLARPRCPGLFCTGSILFAGASPSLLRLPSKLLQSGGNTSLWFYGYLSGWPFSLSVAPWLWRF